MIDVTWYTEFYNIQLSKQFSMFLILFFSRLLYDFKEERFLYNYRKRYPVSCMWTRRM